jgi:hypothetical protein
VCGETAQVGGKTVGSFSKNEQTHGETAGVLRRSERWREGSLLEVPSFRSALLGLAPPPAARSPAPASPILKCTGAGQTDPPLRGGSPIAARLHRSAGHRRGRSFDRASPVTTCPTDGQLRYHSLRTTLRLAAFTLRFAGSWQRLHEYITPPPTTSEQHSVAMRRMSSCAVHVGVPPRRWAGSPPNTGDRRPSVPQCSRGHALLLEAVRRRRSVVLLPGTAAATVRGVPLLLLRPRGRAVRPLPLPGTVVEGALCRPLAPLPRLAKWGTTGHAGEWAPHAPPAASPPPLRGWAPCGCPGRLRRRRFAAGHPAGALGGSAAAAPRLGTLRVPRHRVARGGGAAVGSTVPAGAGTASLAAVPPPLSAAVRRSIAFHGRKVAFHGRHRRSSEKHRETPAWPRRFESKMDAMDGRAQAAARSGEGRKEKRRMTPAGASQQIKRDPRATPGTPRQVHASTLPHDAGKRDRDGRFAARHRPIVRPPASKRRSIVRKTRADIRRAQPGAAASAQVKCRHPSAPASFTCT